jgi:hypothetical protein
MPHAIPAFAQFFEETGAAMLRVAKELAGV